MTNGKSKKTHAVIGLMSGTSADAIDVAWIETDGQNQINIGPRLAVPYSPKTRAMVLKRVACATAAIQGDDTLAKTIALEHANAVKAFQSSNHTGDPDLIGFHGQTVWHDPIAGTTVQLGDAQGLADALSVPVVADLRKADMKAGGQGAPILPAYHAAIACEIEGPIAILNIGGVSNVTLIDDAPAGNGMKIPLLAFDTGPGSAILDDWIADHDAGSMDVDGRYAAVGSVDEDRLDAALQNPYFDVKPPKSLDRNAFAIDLADLSLQDGAALLTEFTARSVAASQRWLPQKPRRWFVTGGGRHNPAIMGRLAQLLEAPVAPIDNIGHDGDALEAQGMAYLAVRSVTGLPLTWPGTTGVAMPCTGGTIFNPKV